MMDREEFIKERIIEEGNIYFEEVFKDKFFIVQSWNDIEYFNKKCEEYGLIDEEGEILNWDNYVAQMGWEWGFSDEYTTCSQCGGLIRTSPDSYSFRPDYFIWEGEINCGDCVREEPEGYINYMIDSNHRCHQFVANSLLSQSTLYNMGFVKLDDKFYNGLHQGMNDEPKDVFAQYEDEYWVIFDFQNSQFYVEFEVFLKEKQVQITYETDEEVEVWTGDITLAGEVIDNIVGEGFKVLSKRTLSWGEEEEW